MHSVISKQYLVTGPVKCLQQLCKNRAAKSISLNQDIRKAINHSNGLMELGLQPHYFQVLLLTNFASLREAWLSCVSLSLLSPCPRDAVFSTPNQNLLFAALLRQMKLQQLKYIFNMSHDFYNDILNHAVRRLRSYATRNVIVIRHFKKGLLRFFRRQ